ncbi:hypothetical protein ULG90_21250 [Halopseudomonas pachastrellae]|nr:hypothetical protein ULG90_21250 [Halopseudomonas pachastrellae]
MSVRSVYRALNERGKTFKGQLDELRQTLAQQYLADETLSLSEIALLLGIRSKVLSIVLFGNGRAAHL